MVVREAAQSHGPPLLPCLRPPACCCCAEAAAKFSTAAAAALSGSRVEALLQVAGGKLLASKDAPPGSAAPADPAPVPVFGSSSSTSPSGLRQSGGSLRRELSGGVLSPRGSSGGTGSACLGGAGGSIKLEQTGSGLAALNSGLTLKMDGDAQTADLLSSLLSPGRELRSPGTPTATSVTLAGSHMVTLKRAATQQHHGPPPGQVSDAMEMDDHDRAPRHSGPHPASNPGCSTPPASRGHSPVAEAPASAHHQAPGSKVTPLTTRDSVSSLLHSHSHSDSKPHSHLHPHGGVQAKVHEKHVSSSPQAAGAEAVGLNDMAPLVARPEPHTPAAAITPGDMVYHMALGTTDYGSMRVAVHQYGGCAELACLLTPPGQHPSTPGALEVKGTLRVEKVEEFLDELRARSRSRSVSLGLLRAVSAEVGLDPHSPAALALAAAASVPGGGPGQDSHVALARMAEVYSTKHRSAVFHPNQGVEAYLVPAGRLAQRLLRTVLLSAPPHHVHLLPANVPPGELLLVVIHRRDWLPPAPPPAPPLTCPPCCQRLPPSPTRPPPAGCDQEQTHAPPLCP
ncbi:hypothetical protein V8C86DRAFT_419512 [Haematococcus lacustris]